MGVGHEPVGLKDSGLSWGFNYEVYQLFCVDTHRAKTQCFDFLGDGGGGLVGFLRVFCVDTRPFMGVGHGPVGLKDSGLSGGWGGFTLVDLHRC